MNQFVWVLLTVGLVFSALAFPQPVNAETQAQVRPLVSGERVRVKKITRDISSAMQQMDQNGVQPFQDPEYIQKWQASYERYKTALAKYPQVNDPDVATATKKLQEFANLIQFGIQQGQKQRQQTGDVQIRLANIEAKIRQQPTLGWLQAPFNQAQATQWFNKAITVKSTADKALAALNDIAQTAYLPINSGTVQSGANYDKQDVNRLINFANSILNKVNDAVTKTEQNLRLQAEMQLKEIAVYSEIDPNDKSDQLNYFLNEGADEKMFTGLDRQMAMAQSFVAYQKAVGKQPEKGFLDRITYLNNVRTNYIALQKKLIGEQALPEAKSTDDNLIKIAKAIIAAPKYKFGEHGPIVITTKEIVQKEKEVSEEEFNDVDISLSGEITLTGTKTTWHYRWDEFTFATPIKDAETQNWYVWWITAKKFHSGGSNTPIGEWVSGKATKGGQILEKTFR